MKNTTTNHKQHNNYSYSYKAPIINTYIIKTTALNNAITQRNQYQCSKPLHPLKIFALWFLRIPNYMNYRIKSMPILFIRIDGIIPSFENLKLSGIFQNISNKRSCLWIIIKFQFRAWSSMSVPEPEVWWPCLNQVQIPCLKKGEINWKKYIISEF